MSSPSLSASALELCEQIVHRANQLHVSVTRDVSGTRLIDCGVAQSGGLEAGRLLAELCLAGRGRVEICPGSEALWPGPAVAVRSDEPVAACLGSQYAGWKISGGDYFAMGSGPMRAVFGDEALYRDGGGSGSGEQQAGATVCAQEAAQPTLGILEASALPPSDICEQIAAKCGIAPTQLTLLVARTASLAGTIQVVARSLETALHKLHELHFDLRQIRAGWGTAPLPPVAKNDLQGIGRTNDAVLYGGDVTLWVRGDDEQLAAVGAQTPSASSRDYGRPFLEIFQHYGGDFYRIDPLLFSPARITLINLQSGKVHRFGQLRADLLARSFATSNRMTDDG